VLRETVSWKKNVRGGRPSSGCRGSAIGRLRCPLIGIIMPLHCDTKTLVAACRNVARRCPTAPLSAGGESDAAHSRLERARASMGGHADHDQNLC
jgi:hypothetical protein